MLPVPIQAEEHETQGLMGSDDNDVSTQSLSTSSNTRQIIPMETTSSSQQNGTNQDDTTQSLTQQESKNKISQRDVNKRIQSYLKESDENCRESATLVAIVIIGLIVTGSVIGFLQLGHHDPSTIHKGSHASVTHIDGEQLPGSLKDWFLNKTNEIDEAAETGTINETLTLGIQPLYRNYLLQTIYEYSFQSAIRIDRNDPIFQHVSMTYGGPWVVPPPPYDDDDEEQQTQRRLQEELSDIFFVFFILALNAFFVYCMERWEYI